ncbi:hypothetical protein EDD15DRAFT_2519217 [Pisolithus albus]|nr:hypothetical protein EDD15DRAFT_2519217 [Pisolithus albus]
MVFTKCTSSFLCLPGNNHLNHTHLHTVSEEWTTFSCCLPGRKPYLHRWRASSEPVATCPAYACSARVALKLEFSSSLNQNAIDVSDMKQVAEFRNLIWPVVEEANKDAPNFSRIFKEMILVASRDKPMLRAGKGTVTKKATLSLYEAEIDALYESVEASATAGIDVPLPSEWTISNVVDWLVVHATAVNLDEPVDPDPDLFEQGFDRNRINGSLKASPDQNEREAVSRISQNIVFSYPTLRVLARQLVNIVTRKADAVDPKAEIEHMVEKYSSGLPGRERNERHVVLITGSTGALGSYIVSSLLQKEDVAQIYALNMRLKTTTSQERQLSTFQDRGLDTDLLESQKLVFVEGDTSQESLGLEEQTYAEIWGLSASPKTDLGQCCQLTPQARHPHFPLTPLYREVL